MRWQREKIYLYNHDIILWSLHDVTQYIHSFDFLVDYFELFQHGDLL